MCAIMLFVWHSQFNDDSSDVSCLLKDHAGSDLGIVQTHKDFLVASWQLNVLVVVNYRFT